MSTSGCSSRRGSTRLRKRSIGEPSRPERGCSDQPTVGRAVRRPGALSSASRPSISRSSAARSRIVGSVLDPTATSTRSCPTAYVKDQASESRSPGSWVSRRRRRGAPTAGTSTLPSGESTSKRLARAGRWPAKKRATSPAGTRCPPSTSQRWVGTSTAGSKAAITRSWPWDTHIPVAGEPIASQSPCVAAISGGSTIVGPTRRPPSPSLVRCTTTRAGSSASVTSPLRLGSVRSLMPRRWHSRSAANQPRPSTARSTRSAIGR